MSAIFFGRTYLSNAMRTRHCNHSCRLSMRPRLWRSSFSSDSSWASTCEKMSSSVRVGHSADASFASRTNMRKPLKHTLWISCSASMDVELLAEMPEHA